jgi:3-hydroxybutyrate dehydrogenase
MPDPAALATSTLAGRCALVTGSTGGLGFAIASRLAQAGCNVVLNGFGDADDIAARRRELEEGHGVGVIHSNADLSDPEAVERLAETAEKQFARVDILVNNAVVRHFASVEDLPRNRWNEALAVNLSSAFLLTQLLLPGMRQRGWGRIVNVSSIYGLFGTSNRIAYVTTKTALLGLARAVASERAGQDIACNAVCPGTVQTPAIDESIDQLGADQGIEREKAVRRYLAGRQPGNRFIDAGNVAALVAFLCGPNGRDINGSALPVDLGWSAIQK